MKKIQKPFRKKKTTGSRKSPERKRRKKRAIQKKKEETPVPAIPEELKDIETNSEIINISHISQDLFKDSHRRNIILTSSGTTISEDEIPDTSSLYYNTNQSTLEYRCLFNLFF